MVPITLLISGFLITIFGVKYMSSRRRRREAPPPATMAGLLRFFEDSTAGVQIQPIHLIIITIIFLVISMILLYFPVI